MSAAFDASRFEPVRAAFEPGACRGEGGPVFPKFERIPSYGAAGTDACRVVGESTGEPPLVVRRMLLRRFTALPVTLSGNRESVSGEPGCSKASPRAAVVRQPGQELEG